MMKTATLTCTAVALLFTASVSHAGLIGVFEFGLGGDTPAALATGFGEDVLAYSDRTHQHNGAAFNDSGVLSTSGSNIIGLPSYLVGGDYVQFANNARDNADYFATVIADQRMNWYLLVDNRLDGIAGTLTSSNTTDPVLGGTLQWVSDGNWTRVNTGISPNGQADYTGIDESGNGVGPGQGLNQFFSVYKAALPTNVVTVFNNGIGGSNMISLVAAPVPEPSSILLALSSFVGLVYLARRERKRRQ